MLSTWIVTGTMEIIGVGWDHYQTLHLYSNDALKREYQMEAPLLRNGDIEVPNGGDQQTAALVVIWTMMGSMSSLLQSGPQLLPWWPINKSGDGWDRYIIDETPQRIEAGSTSHDIDGDGDLDIVFGGEGRSNQVWWWENPHPKHDPEHPGKDI